MIIISFRTEDEAVLFWGFLVSLLHSNSDPGCWIRGCLGFVFCCSVVTIVSGTSLHKAFLKYVKQKNPNEFPLFFGEN